MINIEISKPGGSVLKNRTFSNSVPLPIIERLIMGYPSDWVIITQDNKKITMEELRHERKLDTDTEKRKKDIDLLSIPKRYR